MFCWLLCPQIYLHSFLSKPQNISSDQQHYIFPPVFFLILHWCWCRLFKFYSYWSYARLPFRTFYTYQKVLQCLPQPANSNTINDHPHILLVVCVHPIYFYVSSSYFLLFILLKGSCPKMNFGALAWSPCPIPLVGVNFPPDIPLT